MPYRESFLTTWRKSSSWSICGSLTSESKRTGTGLVSREEDVLLLALERTRIGIAKGGGQRPRAAVRGVEAVIPMKMPILVF